MQTSKSFVPAEQPVYSPLTSRHEVVAASNVTVRLFSSFFHPLGVTEGRVVKQSKGCIAVRTSHDPVAFMTHRLRIVFCEVL